MPAGHWAYDFVAQAVEEGWIAGYGDGTFGTDDQVTYAQLSTMLVQAFFPQSLTDHPDASGAWYEPYCGALAAMGLYETMSLSFLGNKVLEQVGRTSLSNLTVFAPNMSASEYERSQMIKTINAICDSCAVLSKEKIGALIVMEKETKIGDIISTGTIIDSQASADLIKNVFFPNSPLHDGALVIRNSRLYAAGCFLPLSDNYEISRSLGTRHRAALGISEVSDAVVVVVSEETGNITVAKNGKLNIGITVNTLSTILYNEFISSEKESSSERKKKLFRRVKK